MPRGSVKVAAMNTATSLGLGFVILAFAGADYLFNDATALTFLGREMLNLVEYVAFWR